MYGIKHSSLMYKKESGALKDSLEGLFIFTFEFES
jgi:hypothetical protein